MALKDITSSEAVLKAVAEYDAIGQKAFLRKYGFGRSRWFFLVVDGREYDSKAIVGAAHGYQFPKEGPLRRTSFSGGEATVQRLLESLDFTVRVDRPEFPNQLPEEVTGPAPLVEGATCQVTINAYERNPEARRRCIEHYGEDCTVCGFNFGDVYGEAADGYIHVHHLKALSEIGGEYIVDPVKDLRPVCPNCHAVLHCKTPPYSIDEVRTLLCDNR